MNHIEKRYSLRELTEFLKSREFVIYGAGFQARRLYKCLLKMGLQNYVKAFAVTELSDESDNRIDGNIIRPITDFSNHERVLIAAHNKSADQMSETLIKLGFTDFIIMHPYLTVLEFGEPIKWDVCVNVNHLLNKMPELYYVTVIYLAIENYFGKNSKGAELYLKMQGKYSDSHTARVRLEALHEKIKIYTPQTAADDFNIKLSCDNIIIDGNHRAALAKYFGIDSIKADIYGISRDDYADALGEAVFTLDELKRLYDERELALILRADKILRNSGE